MFGRLELLLCGCRPEGLFGFLVPFSLLWFYPRGQTCFPPDEHAEGMSFDCFGEIPLLSMGDEWSQRAARWDAGRDGGRCMRLEGQISVCASV